MPGDARYRAAPDPWSATARVLWAWGPALLAMAGIFTLSGIQDLGPLPGDVSDKTAHYLGYAALGGLVLRGTSWARWSGVTGWSALVAWVICVAYGASDEAHQSVVPGRTPAFDDWVADAAGAATSILLLTIVAGLLRRRGRTV